MLTHQTGDLSRSQRRGPKPLDSHTCPVRQCPPRHSQQNGETWGLHLSPPLPNSHSRTDLVSPGTHPLRPRFWLVPVQHKHSFSLYQGHKVRKPPFHGFSHIFIASKWYTKEPSKARPDGAFKLVGKSRMLSSGAHLHKESMRGPTRRIPWGH